MISLGHVEWEVPESDRQGEGQRWWDLRVGTVRAGLLNSKVRTDHLETSFINRGSESECLGFEQTLEEKLSVSVHCFSC